MGNEIPSGPYTEGKSRREVIGVKHPTLYIYIYIYIYIYKL
jgi:hypothetical protein